MTYLVTLPNFAAYLALAIALLVVFAIVYVRVTPYRELTLIRAGNNAAAITLGGAMLGFVIPLASTIAHSQNIPDMLVWGVVAMAVQIATVGAITLTQRDLYGRVERGETASAALIAAISLCVGILNAACMTT
jgi:putative membrane protein